MRRAGFHACVHETLGKDGHFIPIGLRNTEFGVKRATRLKGAIDLEAAQFYAYAYESYLREFLRWFAACSLQPIKEYTSQCVICLASFLKPWYTLPPHVRTQAH